MKLLLAKAQDWDQVVQSPPRFPSPETNTLDVRITLNTISLSPVLAWRGLFMQLTLMIRLWMNKLGGHSPYVFNGPRWVMLSGDVGTSHMTLGTQLNLPD